MREVMRESGYVTLVSGKNFHVTDPDPRLITKEVLAHHLAADCRYSGATRQHYSVAQHCVLGSYIAPTPNLQKHLLVHDGPEGLGLRDMPSGIKRLPQMAGYRELEDRVMSAVLEACGLAELCPDDHALLKVIDHRLAATEAVQLLPFIPAWVGTGDYIPYPKLAIFPLSAEVAKQAYLDRYVELFG